MHCHQWGVRKRRKLWICWLREQNKKVMCRAHLRLLCIMKYITYVRKIFSQVWNWLHLHLLVKSKTHNEIRMGLTWPQYFWSPQGFSLQNFRAQMSLYSRYVMPYVTYPLSVWYHFRFGSLVVFQDLGFWRGLGSNSGSATYLYEVRFYQLYSGNNTYFRVAVRINVQCCCIANAQK